MFVSKIYKYFLANCLLASCFVTASIMGQGTNEPIFERVIETKSEIAVDDDYTLEISNLVGSVILERNEDNSEKKIESIVTIRAFSKEEKRAQELAEKL